MRTLRRASRWQKCSRDYANAMPSGSSVDHEIIWRPEARSDLYAIYDWIAGQADADTAYAYTSRIETFALRLRYFPNRGTPRADLGSGLRSVTFERRVIVAYRVGPYRVGQSAVFIVRLLGSARNIEGTVSNG